MTTAVLNALQGSAFATFFTRAFDEFQAFFEEADAALVRASRDAPFGS